MLAICFISCLNREKIILSERKRITDSIKQDSIIKELQRKIDDSITQVKLYKKYLFDKSNSVQMDYYFITDFAPKFISFLNGYTSDKVVYKATSVDERNSSVFLKEEENIVKIAIEDNPEYVLFINNSLKKSNADLLDNLKQGDIYCLTDEENSSELFGVLIIRKDFKYYNVTIRSATLMFNIKEIKIGEKMTKYFDKRLELSNLNLSSAQTSY